MALDGFIKIDGIPGESSDEKYADWIEILSFGTGVRQTVSGTKSSAGGATADDQYLGLHCPLLLAL